MPDASGGQSNQVGGIASVRASGGVQPQRLRSFIERIERLEDEKKALSEDIKEVYSEAKGSGFDVKIMKQLIRLRRMDASDRAEMEQLLDVYRQALNMG